MPYAHKVLSAKHIAFPEYHKVYHITQLGNFIDYDSRQMTSSAKFRLECLCKELDIHGMMHPIIVSYNAYEVSVGHQRVWYAKQKGYTHIDCYHIDISDRYRSLLNHEPSQDITTLVFPYQQIILDTVFSICSHNLSIRLQVHHPTCMSDQQVVTLHDTLEK